MFYLPGIWNSIFSKGCWVGLVLFCSWCLTSLRTFVTTESQLTAPVSVTILSHDLAYVVCPADTTTFMRTLDLIFSVHHSLYLQLQWDTHFISSCWILNEYEKKLITCSGSQAVNSRCVGILCSLYHITSKWGFSHSYHPYHCKMLELFFWNCI